MHINAREITAGNFRLRIYPWGLGGVAVDWPMDVEELETHIAAAIARWSINPARRHDVVWAATRGIDGLVDGVHFGLHESSMTAAEKADARDVAETEASEPW